ncbi:type II toxin-antitoxin system HicB family antitoxin [Paenibacillus sp. FSL R5-0914]|uniref:type II toxin-antitoxin system HicB family antitoxin n=1 Tax=Paenibacillus sp. FSL R5-0914 TaxID=2921665 RepID=UPI0030FBF457
MTALRLQILFEEDKAEGNVSAYIPVFRLGVLGDTLEEARANAIDLVQAELEIAKQQGRAIPKDTAIVEIVSIDDYVNQE